MKALLLAALLGSSAHARITCPTDAWVKNPSEDRCYLLTREEMNFESCQSNVCSPAGATLACVNGQEADWLVDQFFSDGDENMAFIGYSDAATEGDWQWLNGCASSYTNWGEGEPNDYCGDEDCAVMGADWWGDDGAWFDFSCLEEVKCLCEYPAALTEVWDAGLEGLRDDTEYECKDEWWDEDGGDEDLAGAVAGLVAAVVGLVVVVVVLAAAVVVLLCVKTQFLGAPLPAMGGGGGAIGRAGHQPMATGVVVGHGGNARFEMPSHLSGYAPPPGELN